MGSLRMSLEEQDQNFHHPAASSVEVNYTIYISTKTFIAKDIRAGQKDIETHEGTMRCSLEKYSRCDGHLFLIFENGHIKSRLLFHDMMAVRK